MIHGAEGNILLYQDLAHHLGPEQPVYGLQAQGLDGKIDLHTRIEDMADYYIKEIQKLQPEGPYYLGGYCMGGGVAYEMAQRLQAKGQKIALLAMLESYNIASDPRSTSLFYRPLIWLQNIKFHLENFMIIRPEDKMRFAIKKTKVEKTRIKFKINVWLAKMAHRFNLNNVPSYPHTLIGKVNDNAWKNYKVKNYPGHVTVFRPQKYFFGASDPQYGWGDYAARGVDVHELPFSPKGMLVEPFVKILAEKLTACINDASQRPPQ